jgi:hypothetical protein
MNTGFWQNQFCSLCRSPLILFSLPVRSYAEDHLRYSHLSFYRFIFDHEPGGVYRIHVVHVSQEAIPVFSEH